MATENAIPPRTSLKRSVKSSDRIEHMRFPDGYCVARENEMKNHFIRFVLLVCVACGQLGYCQTTDRVKTEKTTITYCNEGLHAAMPWFVLAELLGYPNVKLYDDSMSEWANVSDAPVVIGTEIHHSRTPRPVFEGAALIYN